MIYQFFPHALYLSEWQFIKQMRYAIGKLLGLGRQVIRAFSIRNYQMGIDHLDRHLRIRNIRQGKITQTLVGLPAVVAKAMYKSEGSIEYSKSILR